MRDSSPSHDQSSPEVPTSRFQVRPVVVLGVLCPGSAALNTDVAGGLEPKGFALSPVTDGVRLLFSNETQINISLTIHS